MTTTDSVQFNTGGTKFNFVCSKRTFSMLDSPYYQKYSENLICEEIVLKIGLSINDRKCETLSISGIKTEAVGHIRTTAQCLRNGVQTGTIYIKALVVRDFYKLFGSDGLCSEKLKLKLNPPKESIADTSDNVEENFDEPKHHPNLNTTEPTAPKKNKKKTSDSPKTPSQSFDSTPSKSRTPIRTTTPPGFSFPVLSSSHPMTNVNPPSSSPITQPMVPANLPVQPVMSGMSPYCANISRLTAAFGDADLIDGFDQRKEYLAKLDPGGLLEPGISPLSYAFYKSCDPASPAATHGHIYQSGHGRKWCRISCKNLDFHPHNCGHHPQWRLPDEFQYCSSECKCGLCGCLKDYGDYGYYG